MASASTAAATDPVDTRDDTVGAAQGSGGEHAHEAEDFELPNTDVSTLLPLQPLMDDLELPHWVRPRLYLSGGAWQSAQRSHRRPFTWVPSCVCWQKMNLMAADIEHRTLWVASGNRGRLLSHHS